MKKLIEYLIFTVCVFIASVSVQAQTHVSGEVFGVWGPTGNPYIIDSTIVIPPGQSLTLTEGVEVYFRGADSIKVNGVFQVLGTESDSIIIDRAGDTFWKGIYINSNLDTCKMQYCRVSGYSDKIYLETGRLVVSFNTILFNYNDYGRRVFEVTYADYFQLDNSRVRYHPNRGLIYVYGADVVMRKNRLIIGSLCEFVAQSI